MQPEAARVAETRSWFVKAKEAFVPQNMSLPLFPRFWAILSSIASRQRRRILRRVSCLYW
jgi:hypothetical protein